MSNAEQIKAKALVKQAAGAAAELESNVRALVAMRAWEVLGYADFAEMWRVETGFNCPPFVKVIAVMTAAEDITTYHTQTAVADAVGGIAQSAVSGIVKQFNHGVPLQDIRVGGTAQANKVIALKGTLPTTHRPRLRRQGALPSELVSESFALPRRDVDAVFRIASNANTTKSEIYRQAVAEYLARHAAAQATHA